MKVKKLSGGNCYNLIQYKGFKAIEITRLAALAIGFGMMDDNANYICLDCHTGQNITGNIIYVPVLNDTMSYDEFCSWINNATHYMEDGQIEYANAKRTIERLNVFDESRKNKLHSQFTFVE